MLAVTVQAGSAAQTRCSFEDGITIRAERLRCASEIHSFDGKVVLKNGYR